MAIPSNKIAVNLIKLYHNNNVVFNYAQSIVRELIALNQQVTEIGIGTEYPQDFSFKDFDLVLDLDCGRNPDTGELSFRFVNERSPIKSAVWFIDSHGHPNLHHRIARNYDHVFFAVWSKRDIFASHSSAHWCPNATDEIWFNPTFKEPSPAYDFGFFGSKKGLFRADYLKMLCERNQWTCDVRQINAPNKPRWPYTAQAMGNCKVLFNHGQKHDGPNLRVMESMAMGIPLICDEDPLMSGMNKLFNPWEHYYPYQYGTYEGLEDIMKTIKQDYSSAQMTAARALAEVTSKHLIKHRVQQILETSLG